MINRQYMTSTPLPLRKLGLPSPRQNNIGSLTDTDFMMMMREGGTNTFPANTFAGRGLRRV